ncbi:MAG: cytidylate kinase-like family protein [Chloroflexi bacterium]|jgi:cytidylate kinase|nr:cytidylate kinase-like family protein [Chloroflexota bacterium]MBT3863012.1 cytidylate kinase-like family protein [Chloroflexota bacterium]MBT4142737.1 cytidylate kinase-like family protein [Chloroflexota bacterium]MBT4943917.1 cytidylate kinase-like family protein [Chloroflexota bacterium]MBT5252422.1 cytidylate kinase-like family protein [Chloroflexota bacterium]
MSVITIDGQIGAGGPELGKRVARMFDFDYVDRIALPRSVSDTRPKAPVGVTDRFWAIVERAVSGFALGNAAGDPYFNVPEALLLPLTWDSDGPAEKHSQTTASSNVDNLFDLGNAVLVHRAGCVEAGDRSALKVGLFASWEDRVERIMKREGLKSAADAENTIERREKLQREYFGDVYGAQPEDPSLYDIIVDTSSEIIPVASIKVARLARQTLALQTA